MAPSSAKTSPIRLVAIDLDGTLLDDRKRISQPTANVLRSLPSRGVRVVIASARPPRSVRHIYRELGLDTWQINYNGALIWDEPAGNAVFHQPMPGQLVAAMAGRARELYPDVLVSCEILDKWYTDRFDESTADFLTETARLFRPDVVAPVECFCDQPVTKLLLLGPAAMMSGLETMLRADFASSIAVVRSESELLQIMDRRVSKAAALRIVAGHYGIAMEQILAIGDAVNDIEMLKESGVAVAVDNAHALVKAAADWVAPSNNDHGVCAAIRRYVLHDEGAVGY